MANAGDFPARPKRFNPRDLVDEVAGLCQGLGYSVTEVEDRILATAGDYEEALQVWV